MWKFDRDFAKPCLRMEWSGVASYMLDCISCSVSCSSSLSVQWRLWRLCRAALTGPSLALPRVIVARLGSPPGLLGSPPDLLGSSPGLLGSLPDLLGSPPDPGLSFSVLAPSAGFCLMAKEISIEYIYHI